MAQDQQPQAASENAATPSFKMRVRSYRHGLGDCHLLSFTKTDGSRFHILIDCGVIDGTPDRASVMQKVANDIATETRGVLEVLVATHRHTDHLSGFDEAQDVFKNKIAIKRVWFPWTEDPANEQARRIQSEIERRLRAVRSAARKWEPADAEAATAIKNYLNFFGGVDGKNPSTAGILTALRKAEETEIAYYNPPWTFTLDDLPNVRVYVLGPQWNPPQIAWGLNGFVDALDPQGSAGDPELSFPFEKWHRRDAATMKDIGFFKENYFNREDDWRKIDTEWLGSAWDLVGALNDFVNDSSLALAFEFIDSGEVLLFPGDAQDLGWRSWGDVEWSVWDSNGQLRRVRASDLIPRVVFYKASHHASYRGALKGNWGWALDNMTDPNLVCVVPVDHTMTKKMGLERTLPSKLMIDCINRRTRGRTVLTDRNTAGPKSDGLKLLSPMEQQRFANQITVTDDYIDYTL